MIEIETSYALDDSCQMKLWAHGHYPWGAFIEAVEAYLKRQDRNDIPRWVYLQAPVKSVYQRNVPCKDSIVSDNMFVYADKPGRGASPVTVLDFWFPLHRHCQQDADKVDAEKYRRLHTPEIKNFLAAVENEAIYQRERWGQTGDIGKSDADWFWLIGYLSGKAIRPDATDEKRLHHIITTAAACLNWHAARVGTYVDMRPGIADPDAIPATEDRQ